MQLFCHLLIFKNGSFIMEKFGKHQLTQLIKNK